MPTSTVPDCTVEPPRKDTSMVLAAAPSIVVPISSAAVAESDMQAYYRSPGAAPSLLLPEADIIAGELANYLRHQHSVSGAGSRLHDVYTVGLRQAMYFCVMNISR